MNYKTLAFFGMMFSIHAVLAGEQLHALNIGPYNFHDLLVFRNDGTVLAGPPIDGVGINGNAEVETLQVWDYSPAVGQGWAMSGNRYLYGASYRFMNAYNTQYPFFGLGFPNALDVNPLNGEIRFLTTVGANFFLDRDDLPTLHALPAIAYSPGDPHFSLEPLLTGLAFDNNYPGATSTRLYGIDANTDSLVYFEEPNGGTIRTIGPLGLDFDGYVGFNISGSLGIAYASVGDVLTPSIWKVAPPANT